MKNDDLIQMGALNISDSTVSFQEWSNHMINRTVSNGHMAHITAGEYLNDAVTGFMLHPVGVYNQRAIVAKAIETKSIWKFRNLCRSRIASGVKIFIHMPIWYPSYCEFKKPMHSSSEGDDMLNKPILVDGCWRIRFAEVA